VAPVRLDASRILKICGRCGQCGISSDRFLEHEGQSNFKQYTFAYTYYKLHKCLNISAISPHTLDFDGAMTDVTSLSSPVDFSYIGGAVRYCLQGCDVVV